MKRFGLLSVLVALSMVVPARAEIWIGDSLEWMTDDSQLIVRGKVMRITPVKGPEALGFLEITVSIAEVVKGMYPEKTITIRSWHGELKDGVECVLFLKQGHDMYGAKDYRRPVVGNRWTQRLSSTGIPHGSIDLANPGSGQGFITAGFTLLKKRDQILATVRERVKRTQKQPRNIRPVEPDPLTGFPMPPLGAACMEVPIDSEAFRRLFGGSAVMAYVPADPELYPKIVAEIKNRRAYDLVSVLANYPGEETEKLLRELLRDSTTTTTYNAQRKAVAINYPMRSAAYGALLRLGIRVQPPVLVQHLKP